MSLVVRDKNGSTRTRRRAAGPIAVPAGRSAQRTLGARRHPTALLATLAGMLVRGRKLPWNREKSWAGLAAFLLCAIPLATLVYWAEARPGVALSLACACVAPAVLMAALAESLPVRINDNIRVGVIA